MSNQIQATGAVKIRSLTGALTASAGVVTSVPLGGANGVATLDALGKVPLSQLPASVVTYLGTWNAATNTPTLANGTGDVGDLYICNAAGTVNFGAGPITFAVGDWVIYSGTTWQKSAGASGTVTSVAATVPTGLTVTGSPITTSGTLAFGLASGYVIPTQATIDGKVPYTGATGNVDLGEYELKAGQLTLDVSPTGTPTVGTTLWNNTIGSSETLLKGGSVLLKNGVDLVARVVNKVTPNTTLTKANYPAVRVSGAAGQRLAVAYAQANNDNNSADTIGLVTETIATNQEGFIMTVGQLLDINTTGSLQGETWADGDVLYLSPTTAGALTNIKPTGLTGHIVVMGYVEYAHAIHGSIYVKVMNGWELDELHNVYITSPTNNQGLFYNSSNSLWENKSIATVLGYTPANDSLVVHLAGTETITGGKIFNQTQLFNNGIISSSDLILDGKNILKQGVAMSYSTGYNTLLATTTGLSIGFPSVRYSNLVFDTTSNYTYTFPSATGTLALTSDLSSYLPLTGGTISTTSTSSALTIINSGTGYGLYVQAGVTYLQGGLSIQGTTTLVSISASSMLKTNSSGILTAAVAGTDYQAPLTNPVTGTGTTNYHPKFTGTSTIGNSGIYEGATGFISIGNTNSTYNLDVTGTGRFKASDSQLTLAHSAGTYSTVLVTNSIGNFYVQPNGSFNALTIANTGAATFSSSVTAGAGSFTASSGWALQGYSNNSASINAANGSGYGLYVNSGTSASSSTYTAQFVGNGSTQFYIRGDGNVGIGTSSPGSLLTLYATTTPTIAFQNAGAVRGYISADSGNNIYNAVTGNGHVFQSDGSEKMRLTSAGEFLVGMTGVTTTSTGSMISQGGSYANVRLFGTGSQTFVQFFLSGTAMGSITGSGSTTSYNTSSDYRLKEDFKEINGIEKVNAIKVYDFKFKNSNERMDGVLAHELQEVLPYAVTGEKDGKEMQGVDYSKITPINTKAIQELYAIVQEQNQLITDLTNRLNKLENK